MSLKDFNLMAKNWNFWTLSWQSDHLLYASGFMKQVNYYFSIQNKEPLCCLNQSLIKLYFLVSKRTKWCIANISPGYLDNLVTGNIIDVIEGRLSSVISTTHACEDLSKPWYQWIKWNNLLYNYGQLFYSILLTFSVVHAFDDTGNRVDFLKIIIDQLNHWLKKFKRKILKKIYQFPKYFKVIVLPVNDNI